MVLQLILRNEERIGIDMAQDKEKSEIFSMNDILAAEDTEYREVKVWGGIVRVGSLTAGELLEFVEANAQPDSRKTSGLRLIIKSIVDENGNRLGKEEHLEGLKSRNSQQIEKLTHEILNLNGLGKKAEGEAKTTKEERA